MASQTGPEMKFKLSNHARQEMQRRSIPLSLVESALQHPQQIVPERAGKRISRNLISAVVRFSCCGPSSTTALIRQSL
jgi:hypothetical protein